MVTNVTRNDMQFMYWTWISYCTLIVRHVADQPGYYTVWCLHPIMVCVFTLPVCPCVVLTGTVQEPIL